MTIFMESDEIPQDFNDPHDDQLSNIIDELLNYDRIKIVLLDHENN